MSEATLQSVTLALYVLLSFVFCISSLLFAKVVAPSRPNPRKALTYECGQVPAGPTKSRFTIQYYPYAAIYAVYGALAIVLLLSAPSIRTIPPTQLWMVLLILASFTFALMGALAAIKPLIRPKRR